MNGDVNAMAARIDELLAGFDAAGMPRSARERAEELVRTVVGMYGEGIERMLTIVHETLGDQSDAVFARLCEDRFSESLLCLHGLHPVAVADRVDAALQSVLPYIRSHKGNMEVTRIEDGVVYVQLEGSCDGCAASAQTLKLAVERAILERVPEIHAVVAENVSAITHAAPGTPNDGPVVLSAV